MNVSDKKRFAGIIGTLAEMYHRKSSKLLIQAYWHALRDLSIDQVQAAAVALMATQRFFPRPVEFRKLACSEPDSTDAAWQQADVVLGLIRTEGPNARGGLDDPVTRQIVDSYGGYRHLCRTMQESETKWWRKEFVERYLAAARTAAAQDAYRALGKTERLPENVRQLVTGIG